MYISFLELIFYNKQTMFLLNQQNISANESQPTPFVLLLVDLLGPEVVSCPH